MDFEKGMTTRDQIRCICAGFLFGLFLQFLLPPFLFLVTMTVVLFVWLYTVFAPN